MRSVAVISVSRIEIIFWRVLGMNRQELSLLGEKRLYNKNGVVCYDN